MSEESIYGSMQEIREAWADCQRCPLGQPGTSHRKNVVFGCGNEVDPKILIVGEAPGPSEDEAGIPFIGTTGQKLRSTLVKVGVSPEQDCFITNSVLCFPFDPGKNSFRGPLGYEILACRPRLAASARMVLPSVRVLLLLGKRALVALLQNHLLEGGGLDTESGWNKPSLRMKDSLGWVQDRRLEHMKPGLKAYCTYHPSYVVRNKASLASRLNQEWELDLMAVKRWALDGEHVVPRVL